MLTIRVPDLKNQWVVYKRVKKQNWFHRGPNYQTCTVYTYQASRWLKQEEAKAFCDKLNEGRKAYRFRLATADKFFVNNWTIQYQSWHSEVIIESSPISLSDLAANKSYNTKYTPDLDSQKGPVLAELDRRIFALDTEVKATHENLITNLAHAEKEYKRQIEHYNAQHVSKLKTIEEGKQKLAGTKSVLESTDLDVEYVEKFSTPMDKKAKILFGRRNVNTQTTT